MENGYTGKADELLEAYCKFRIPGELRQVLDCIERKTYGYHKKMDWIAQSQIAEMTEMNRSNVNRSLSKLITHKLVIKNDNQLGINKNYEEWIPFKGHKVIKNDNKEKVIKNDSKVIISDQKVIKNDSNKRDLTKDNNKKEYSNEIRFLAKLLKNQVKRNYPFVSGNPVETDFDEIDKLHRIDGYDYKMIKAVIDWSQADGFWKQNIRSGSKLRQKFEDLLVRIKSNVVDKRGKNYDE